MTKDPHRYDDMLLMPHHVSKNHPQMSIYNRAAQFSPFQALTGYEDAIEETARYTDTEIELTEDERNLLDQTFTWITQNLHLSPKVSITYFQPDTQKSGGTYQKATGQVIKIKSTQRIICLKASDADYNIPIDRILQIQRL